MKALDIPDVISAIEESQRYPEVIGMLKGENLKEGLAAFNQKRKPDWKIKSSL